MKLTNFTLAVDADGIALATWDMPGRSMNVITPEVMIDLDTLVDHVVADAAIKGCVITSGNYNQPDSWVTPMRIWREIIVANLLRP